MSGHSDKSVIQRLHFGRALANANNLVSDIFLTYPFQRSH